jgi:hypothetical protein
MPASCTDSREGGRDVGWVEPREERAWSSGRIERNNEELRKRKRNKRDGKKS